MPKTNEHVNKIFCKTFIAFTSSPVYLMLPGKTRSRAAYYQGNLSATDALMTFQAGIWLEMILSSSPVFYKTLRFPLFSYENVNSSTPGTFKSGKMR
jgi:hypothetical protein